MKIKQILLIIIASCLLYGCSQSVNANQEYSLEVIGKTGVIDVNLTGEKEFNTSNLLILVFKIESNKEDLVIEFDETIDSEVRQYHNQYLNESFLEGEYTIKMYSGEAEILAEKTFNIK